MPPIYISTITNVIQFTSESNAKSYVQANTNVTTTTRGQNTIFTDYTSPTTTIPPKGPGTVAIVFIVLGAIILFILLCFIIRYIYRRRRSHTASPTPTPASALVRSHPTPAPAPIRPPHTPAPVPIRPPSTHPATPVISSPRWICYKPLCRQYLQELNLNDRFFESRYDQCFCKKCHDPSDPNKKCGRWCRQLHGWVRFGLQLSKVHQKQWNIFDQWETSYYGTSSNRLASILHSRFIPFDGDKLAGDIEFNSGHPDRTHCTTSPSLVHSSGPNFTSLSYFRARDGTNYNVQVVLQCKQKPDAYTVLGNPRNFHDTEWATTNRGALVPYGLLVRLRLRK